METSINEEIFTGLSPDPISIEGTERILGQMRNSICKICKENGQKGTGFFCLIPIKNNHLLPVLITNNHVLNKEDINNKKVIKVTLNDDKDFANIIIDESRKKFTSSELDVTIVEIKPKVDQIKNFLEVDPDINTNENILEELYKKKSIYLLHYPKGKNINVSYGLSIGVKETEIYHICNTEEGSSGSPIISLNSFKVIGIHIGGKRNGKNETNKFLFNIGSLIKYAIDAFKINIYNMNDIKDNNNKNNKKKNEMTIIYKLGDFDNEIKLFGEEFVKKNKEKCVLIIDGKEKELCEVIDTNDLSCIKKNILKIKLKEINTITDMSYMFSKCPTLVDLPDISEWNTSSVTNMKYMFDSCEALSGLPDISKWDTTNVTDMSFMFNYCISLPYLPDISKWKTTNLSDKSNMFHDCKESLNIPSKFINNN